MSSPRDDWLSEALATRDLERVTPNMPSAGERINDARRHVRSARHLAEDDPTLAVAACHDAIRKAITAHMAADGMPASRTVFPGLTQLVCCVGDTGAGRRPSPTR